jgi:hypothetical protein
MALLFLGIMGAFKQNRLQFLFLVMGLALLAGASGYPFHGRVMFFNTRLLFVIAWVLILLNSILK